ncbi:neur_chan_LBD domain-containing protein [Caerostris extrusa]|uniref:Neur_chan_LBD domain-containing protein n=1 Tax=Caerostris extrusa TaxID=172846 RepID=A0AAV4SBT5_CAEEX|nr:neur_chan_LBD domain-containing protein [Caerostris extrusa]
MCIVFIYVADSAQGPHEKRLLNDLLSNYNVLERPVANESEPLLISFGLTLQQIIDVVILIKDYSLDDSEGYESSKTMITMIKFSFE